jgi:hypothetical protein
MASMLLCPGPDPVALLIVWVVIVASLVAAGAAVGLVIARVIRAVKESRPGRLK